LGQSSSDEAKAFKRFMSGLVAVEKSPGSFVVNIRQFIDSLRVHLLAHRTADMKDLLVFFFRPSMCLAY
jgi:hypothetical protein